MIFFPEASDFISESTHEAVALTMGLEESPFVKNLRDAAKAESIWVSVGVHEKV